MWSKRTTATGSLTPPGMRHCHSGGDGGHGYCCFVLPLIGGQVVEPVVPVARDAGRQHIEIAREIEGHRTVPSANHRQNSRTEFKRLFRRNAVHRKNRLRTVETESIPCSRRPRMQPGE